jgi:hypothetical protein
MAHEAKTLAKIVGCGFQERRGFALRVQPSGRWRSTQTAKWERPERADFKLWGGEGRAPGADPRCGHTYPPNWEIRVVAA